MATRKRKDTSADVDHDAVTGALEAYQALNEEEQELFDAHSGDTVGECDGCHKIAPLVCTDQGNFCAWGCD